MPYKTPQRKIRHILDNEPLTLLTPIVLVPVDDSTPPTYAIINQHDYDTLTDLGISEIWRLDKDGRVTVWSPKARRHLPVARLIMDAGPGEGVYHRDRDRFNLRKTNLVLSDSHRATTRDRDLIDPDSQRDWSRIVHEWEYIIPKIGYNVAPPQPIKHYTTPFGIQYIS